MILTFQVNENDSNGAADEKQELKQKGTCDLFRS